MFLTSILPDVSASVLSCVPFRITQPQPRILAYSCDVGQASPIHRPVRGGSTRTILVYRFSPGIRCAVLFNSSRPPSRLLLKNTLLHLQVYEALPEHLLLQTVLPLVPLSHCFQHLPSTLHTLALRAHHPSIDSCNSLVFPLLSPAHLATAFAAAESLTMLRTVSLADATLPSDASFLSRTLPALRDVSSLNLRNCGMATAAASAVAVALPSLPHLSHLDLSANRIALPAVQALSVALAQCTSLRSLILLQSLHLRPGCYASLTALAAAVSYLPDLNALSLGGCDADRRGLGGDAFAAGLAALLENLQKIPDMRSLALDFPRESVLSNRAHAAGIALANATQLVQLKLAMTFFDGRRHRSKHPVLRAVQSLTQLTSLDVEVCDYSFASNSYRWVNPLPGGLQALQGLRELRSTYNVAEDNVAVHIPRIVPRLHQLSVLDVRVICDPTDLSLTNVFNACQSHNAQLQTVRLPIFLSLPSSRSQIHQLLQISHLQRLSVDLHANNLVTGFEYEMVPQCIPLFPSIQTLDLGCSRDSEWLRPLVDHITALTQLHSLRIYVVTVPNRGQARDILESISALGSLRALHVDVAGLSRKRVRRLSAFTDRLSHLTQLTSLSCDICQRGREYAKRYLPGLVPACVRMTQLHVLMMGAYHEEGHLDCMRVLPHLPLHELWMVVYTSAEARLLRELLVQLGHLRALHVDGGMSEEAVDGLKSAASMLQACHTVCVDGVSHDMSVYERRSPNMVS